MESSHVSMLRYFINLSFFLYFMILLAERAQSIVRCFLDKSLKTDALDIYMYVLVILSLVGAFVFLTVNQRAMFSGLFTRNAEVYDKIDLGLLSIASGIILFSGMVHTEYTIPGIQFASYGALVLAMILQTADRTGQGQSTFALWITLAYIVAFSMALPVVYRSEIKLHTLFHIIEIIVSAVMIVSFTIMMKQLFLGNGIGTFNICIILFAAVGDAVLVAMRWKEKVNSFVLIFIVLSVVLWTIGRIAVTGKQG